MMKIKALILALLVLACIGCGRAYKCTWSITGQSVGEVTPATPASSEGK